MITKLQVINLDPTFKPIRGSHEISFKSHNFSSGIEPHIKLNIADFDEMDEAVTVITTRPKNGNDLFLAFLATDAVRQIKPTARIWLFMPFIPFARQDRGCDLGEPLSVRVYTNLINLQNYERVIVFDPHSDVAPALIRNCQIINNHRYIDGVYRRIKATMIESGNLRIASPDTGAYKKIFSTAQYLGYDKELIACDKVRDMTTGRIIKTVVPVDDLYGENVLIIDDIIDGGRTFIEIAKVLRTKNCGKIFLAVSFGIFSNGFDELQKYIDHVFCTNFIDVKYSDYVTPMEVEFQLNMSGTKLIQYP